MAQVKINLSKSIDNDTVKVGKVIINMATKGIPGDDGADGRTSYVHIKYSPNSTGIPMSETPDTYMGIYSDFSEDDSNDPSLYQWVRIEGVQGDRGIAGSKGEDGRTSYLHIAYANSADGVIDFSTSESDDRRYIGTYSDFIEDDSDDPSRYKWTMVKGDLGLSIIYTDVEYAKSDSNSVAPDDGWTTLAPTWEEGMYIWSRVKTTYSDTSSVTSNPVCITGSSGLGIKSIVEYYAISDSKTEPPLTGWETTPPAWVSGMYIWTKSIITYTDNSTHTVGIYCDSSWEAINDVEVGAVNLVNQDFEIADTNNYRFNELIYHDTVNSQASYSYTKLGVNPAYIYKTTINVKADESYTFSVWVKGSYAGTSLRVHKSTDTYINLEKQSDKINIWERVVMTHKFSEDIENLECFVYLPIIDGAEVLISSVQIERGNKATDFRLSQADLDNKYHQYADEAARLAEEAANALLEETAEALRDGLITEEEREAILEAQLAADEAAAQANIAKQLAEAAQNGVDINNAALDRYTKETDNHFVDIDAKLLGLESQVDGLIQSYTGEETPTLDNYPANEWLTDADKHIHEEDIYNQLEGDTIINTYKFVKLNGTYQWVLLSDSQAGLAQQIANEAMAIAGERAQIFYSNTYPSAAYKQNDIWVDVDDNTMYIALKDRGVSSSLSDWLPINDTMYRIAQMSNDLVISIEDKVNYRNLYTQILLEYAQYEVDALHYEVDINSLKKAKDALIDSFIDVYDILLVAGKTTDTNITEEQHEQHNQLTSNYYAERTKLANAIAEAITQGIIDNIQIGGVNLFDGSNFENGLTNGWTTNTAYMSKSVVDGIAIFEFIGTLHTMTYRFYNNLPKGVYTISVNVRVSDISKIDEGYIYPYSTSLVKNMIYKKKLDITRPSEEWQTLVTTFEAVEDIERFRFGLYIKHIDLTQQVGELVMFKWCKLEVGHFATPYTLSPADLKSNYEAYANSIAEERASLAEMAANAKTEDAKKQLETAITSLDAAKANADDVYSKAMVDGIITSVEAYALQKANDSQEAAIANATQISNAYADGILSASEEKITTAYQNYADAAQEAAIVAASVAADGKITSSEERLTTAYEGYADAAKQQAIATSNAYADGVVTDSETKITDAYEYYTNRAKELAIATSKAYADGEITASETKIIDAYEAYADAAKQVAINTSNSYADGVLSASEAKITNAYRAYADTAKELAITTANAYSDGEITASETKITDAYEKYADAVKELAITTANSYADGEITASEAKITEAYTLYADAAKQLAIASANAYIDGEITSSEERVTDAYENYVEMAKQLAITTANAYADGEITESEARAIAAAQEKATAAQQAAEEAAKELVEGLNLGLINYANQNFRAFGSSNYQYNGVDNSDMVNNQPSYLYTKIGSNTATVYSKSMSAKYGDTYTFSVWVKSSSLGAKIVLASTSYTINEENSVTNQWERIVLTHTFDRDIQYLYFYIYLPTYNGTTVKISSVQIEKGDSASDFTLSRYDFDQQISEAYEIGVNISGRIDEWADDNYISPSEKFSLTMEIRNIIVQRQSVINLNKFGIDMSSYYNAYNNYYYLLTKYTDSNTENIAIVDDITSVANLYYNLYVMILDAINDASSKDIDDSIADTVKPFKYLNEVMQEYGSEEFSGVSLSKVMAVVDSNGSDIAFMSGLEDDYVSIGAHSHDAYKICSDYLKWMFTGGTEPEKPNFMIDYIGTVHLNNASVSGVIESSANHTIFTNVDSDNFVLNPLMQSSVKMGGYDCIVPRPTRDGLILTFFWFNVTKVAMGGLIFHNCYVYRNNNLSNNVAAYTQIMAPVNISYLRIISSNNSWYVISEYSDDSFVFS